MTTAIAASASVVAHSETVPGQKYGSAKIQRVKRGIKFVLGPSWHCGGLWTTPMLRILE